MFPNNLLKPALKDVVFGMFQHSHVLMTVKGYPMLAETETNQMLVLSMSREKKRDAPRVSLYPCNF